jgi:hypothetical protein
MRIEFFSRLTLLVVAAFLVVATQVWSGGTLEWLFIVGGAAMLALAAADTGTNNRLQRGLDGILAVLGVWSIVEAIVFNGGNLEWVSFATALAAGLIAIVGLIAHEASTERVVHELQVTPAREPSSAFAS